MQEIADSLDISRVTVWKVFNQQSGVSDTLRQQVLSKAKELGYTKINYATINESTNSQLTFSETVSVVVSRPESSMFWMSIIHEIAKELNKYNINLMYTYLPSKISDDYTLPISLIDGSIQGLIILNVYNDQLIEKLSTLKIPKVFLDTVTNISPESLNGDLLLLEGNSTVYQITKSLIERGKKEIGFIGDIHYARTNMERYNGYQTAMKEYHLPISNQCTMIHHIGIETYAEEITEFLNHIKKMPEAFVCVSDYVANFLFTYFYEHNKKVPKDIIITGFDEAPEYSNLSDMIITVSVDTHMIGIRLVKQLLYRIQNSNFPFETTFLSFPIKYGESLS